MRGLLLLTALATAAGCAPAAPVEVSPASCHVPGVTLWLDFEGATVVYAAGDDASATPVQSALAPTSAVVPPFDSGPVAPSVTRDQAIASIVDRVRTLFAPYAVDVVTERPAAPPFTRVLIGGTPDSIGVQASEAGLALVDCGNGEDNNVAYDFAGEQTPDYGGVVSIANTAAHEAGHAFGLEHVDRPLDVMYAAASPALTLPDLFTLSFGSGNFSDYGNATRACTKSDPVDEVAELDCNVGVRAPGGDVTPPTLSWGAPTGPITGTLTVSATAADDVAVARVEFYKNLELVASLAAPPYTAQIQAAPGERFYVTVEAIDTSANRATVTHDVTAAPSTGGGDGGTMTGMDPPGTGYTGMPSTGSSGCAVVAGGGRGGAAGIVVMVLLGMLAATGARRRIRERADS